MAGTSSKKPTPPPPLCYAAELGDAEEVTKLLGAADVDVEVVNNRGFTPLACAAHNTATTRTARLLIAAGANLNAVAPDSGLTPLHIACKASNHKMVTLLLAKGADASIVDAFGRTALSWAALGGSTASVQAILAATGDSLVNVQDFSGYSPLMIASEYGREEVLELLLELGADRTLPNKLTHTAAELADWYGRHAVLKRLLTPAAAK